jgi:hypothetical protein
LLIVCKHSVWMPVNNTTCLMHCSSTWAGLCSGFYYGRVNSSGSDPFPVSMCVTYPLSVVTSPIVYYHNDKINFKRILFSSWTERVTQGASGTPASTSWSTPLCAQEWMRGSCVLPRHYIVTVSLLKLNVIDISLLDMPRYYCQYCETFIFSNWKYFGFVWNICHVPPDEWAG